MPNFWFARHGMTEPNRLGVRCGGDMDVPLLEEGREHARAIARELQRREAHPRLILTGTLARTQETARIVAEALGGLAIECDEVFNERRLGGWNGLPIADTETLLAAKVTPPGGESEAEFGARVGRALQRIEPHAPLGLLVVSSKGVGRILHALSGAAGRLALANGEVVEFRVPMPPRGPAPPGPAPR